MSHTVYCTIQYLYSYTFHTRFICDCSIWVITRDLSLLVEICA